MLSSAYLLLAAAFNLVRFVSGTNNNNNNSSSDTGNFTVINGQVFTPGLVVVDAPQPFTPLGGGKFCIRSHSPSRSPRTQLTTSSHPLLQTSSKSPSTSPAPAVSHGRRIPPTPPQSSTTSPSSSRPILPAETSPSLTPQFSTTPHPPYRHR